MILAPTRLYSVNVTHVFRVQNYCILSVQQLSTAGRVEVIENEVQEFTRTYPEMTYVLYGAKRYLSPPSHDEMHPTKTITRQYHEQGVGCLTPPCKSSGTQSVW